MLAKPMLFSAEMARAILDGRKTQTRRPIGLSCLQRSETPGYDWTWRGQGPVRSIGQQRRHPGGCWQDVSNAHLLSLCPHPVGSLIYGRETFAPADAAGHRCAPRDAAFVVMRDGAQVYRDGAVSPALPVYAQGAFAAIRWRPSIHMPKWAARIWLEVTDVRVERLHDISEADAIAEGFAEIRRERWSAYDPFVDGTVEFFCEPDREALENVRRHQDFVTSARDQLKRAWNSMYPKRFDRWTEGTTERSPWVWAYTFRRVERPA